MPARFTPARPTVRLLLTSLLAVMVGTVLTLPGSLWAYQPAPADAAAAPAADPAAAAPAAAPAAAAPEGAAPAAAPAGGAQPAAAAPAATQTTMLQLIGAGLGWVWGPIFLILSFIMVAVIMMNLLQLRRETLLPASFVEMFEQKLQAKDYQGAYDIAPPTTPSWPACWPRASAVSTAATRKRSKACRRSARKRR